MTTGSATDDRHARLERRLGREQRARQEAEALLEGKSLELYSVNQALSQLASELELRVQSRTRELVEAQERALELAERDQLTGLANRTRFSRLLKEAAQRATSDRSRFALFLVDLDKFKDINDTLGHDAGDAFLQHAASQLRMSVRDCDIVARLGGDEFAALCTLPVSVEDAAPIAGRMASQLRTPFHYDGRIVSSSGSIGYAVFPADSGNIAELRRFADLALYRSKSLGRATFTAFTASMGDEIERRQRLELELREGIHTGTVEPWYQIIVNPATGRAVGAEALARWRHPTLGLQPPDVFIRLAEECGLMSDLFGLMLCQAVTDAAPWITNGAIEYVSVNVSPSQIKAGTLANDVLACLRELEFPPRSLVLEITEDVLLYDLEPARAQLEQLSERGIRIAIDDFGTGYSNFRYLRRLPVHLIKLDRTLASDVVVDDKSRAIVRAISDIASALGLEIVAEGVESAAQAEALFTSGCRYLQGYHFSRPVSAIALQSLLFDANGAATAA